MEIVVVVDDNETRIRQTEKLMHRYAKYHPGSAHSIPPNLTKGERRMRELDGQIGIRYREFALDNNLDPDKQHEEIWRQIAIDDLLVERFQLETTVPIERELDVVEANFQRERNNLRYDRGTIDGVDVQLNALNRRYNPLLTHLRTKLAHAIPA